MRSRAELTSSVIVESPVAGSIVTELSLGSNGTAAWPGQEIWNDEPFTARPSLTTSVSARLPKAK